MELNSSYKICLILINQKLHVRAIAKLLQTNHMTILRALKELTTKNIIDFEEIGRNKSYYLKKTIEAKSFVISSEMFKARETIEKYPSLRRIIGSIQQNQKIKVALIFGSYAKGTVKENSDIDIYIETNNLQVKREVEIIDSRASVKIGKFDETTPLGKEIMMNHAIIKGAEQFYENKSIFKDII